MRAHNPSFAPGFPKSRVFLLYGTCFAASRLIPDSPTAAARSLQRRDDGIAGAEGWARRDAAGARAAGAEAARAARGPGRPGSAGARYM